MSENKRNAASHAAALLQALMAALQALELLDEWFSAARMTKNLEQRWIFNRFSPVQYPNTSNTKA